MKLNRIIESGIAAVALALGVPSDVQAEPYKDYTPSDEVVEMTLVKVDEGQLDTYLAGLKQTWVSANEVQKKLGHIKDYGIFEVPYGVGKFNIVLVITFPSTEAAGPNKQRYLQFLEAYGKANIDAGNKTMIDVYNKIRTIQGTYLLRELTISK